VERGNRRKRSDREKWLGVKNFIKEGLGKVRQDQKAPNYLEEHRM